MRFKLPIYTNFSPDENQPTAYMVRFLHLACRHSPDSKQLRKTCLLRMSGQTSTLIQKPLDMNKSNRDLLVLNCQDAGNPEIMEQRMQRLHELLFQAERLDNFIKSHELIDLNRYKILSGSFELKKWVRKKKDIPFVFLNSLN